MKEILRCLPRGGPQLLRCAASFINISNYQAFSTNISVLCTCMTMVQSTAIFAVRSAVGTVITFYGLIHFNEKNKPILFPKRILLQQRIIINFSLWNWI